MAEGSTLTTLATSHLDASCSSCPPEDTEEEVYVDGTQAAVETPTYVGCKSQYVIIISQLWTCSLLGLQRPDEVFTDTEGYIYAVRAYAPSSPRLIEGVKKAFEILAARTQTTTDGPAGGRHDWGFKRVSFGMTMKKGDVVR